jgi:hypothetical protein
MTSTPDDEKRTEKFEKPSPDPIGSAARAARRTRKLPQDAACVICGERNPIVLEAKERRRSVLEQNHVFCEANDPDTIVVMCRNHHAIATADQVDIGALRPGIAPSALERLTLALMSLAMFLIQLANGIYNFALDIVQTVRVLDENFPNWRSLPDMP